MQGTPQSQSEKWKLQHWEELAKQLMVPQRDNYFSSSSDIIVTTCFGHMTIIKCHTVVYCLKLFAWLQKLLAGYVSEHYSN
jgi:hypothetical protein